MSKKDDTTNNETPHLALSVTDEFASRLLERPPQSEYSAMWSDLLKREKGTPESEEQDSLLLFKLAEDWIGINTMCLEEVVERKQVHTVPHSRSSILHGVVNHRGQIRLCVDMHGLLNINAKEKNAPSHANEDQSLLPGVHLQYTRMLAISRSNEVWIFPVDTVLGVINYRPESLIDVPVNISKSTANYLKGILRWEDKKVAVLDEELVFESLRRLVP